MAPVTRPADHSSGNYGGGTAVPYIPLSDPDTRLTGNGVNGDASIGMLVRDASAHMSTLVRAEVELAKAEVVGEVKKGIVGSAFFIVAATVLLYSTFFVFFTLAEALSEPFWRWAAFLIVLLLMWATAGIFAFLGYRKVKKIKAPERTIGSMKETAATLKRKPSAEHDQLTSG